MTVPAHKKRIMIHCLATSPAWGDNKTAAIMVDEVRQWHTRERGWKDIGYAEIIDYEGRRAKGRDLNDNGSVFDDTGAGAAGHNRDVIHIALAGGRWPDGRWALATDSFSDHFTAAQDRALREAIAEINRLAGRELEVLGHNQVDRNKGCPGFNVPRWYASAPVPARPVASNPVADSPAPQTNSKGPVAAFLALLARIFGGGK